MVSVRPLPIERLVYIHYTGPQKFLLWRAPRENTFPVAIRPRQVTHFVAQSLPARGTVGLVRPVCGWVQRRRRLHHAWWRPVVQARGIATGSCGRCCWCCWCCWWSGSGAKWSKVERPWDRAAGVGRRGAAGPSGRRARCRSSWMYGWSGRWAGGCVGWRQRGGCMCQRGSGPLWRVQRPVCSRWSVGLVRPVLLVMRAHGGAARGPASRSGLTRQLQRPSGRAAGGPGRLQPPS